MPLRDAVDDDAIATSRPPLGDAADAVRRNKI
jgi:hypothetical protein